MTDKDFHKIIELSNVGGGFIPVNEKAIELLEQSYKGEVLSFLEVTNRDLKLHRCYFELLSFIYDYLPPIFKKKIKKEKFYLFIKHLKKEYDVFYTFEDGSQLMEYESIAFGNMSNMRFKEYIKEQLPFIYTNIIGKFFEGEMYNGIIDTIETEFEKFFAKL
jgi:hypothetical protein